MSESKESPVSGEAGPGVPGASPADGIPRYRVPWWLRGVPFVLSAFLFLSGLFAVFSPLPLLLFGLQKDRRTLVWLAAITNGALVLMAAGPTSFWFYLVFVLVIAVSMPEFLKRKLTLEKTALYALLAVAGSGLALVLVHAVLHHQNPAMDVRNRISGLTDYVIQSLSPETRSSWMGGSDPEDWKRSLLVELPSAIAIFSLVMVWANLMIALRVNPGGIREKLGLDAGFFKRWKAPELLLWPTVVSGFFLVVDVGWPSDVALNIFKFLMAVYAIQGLSILSFVFDVWHIRGFFRTVGYVLAVFLMMPLLLSLGFFDQWFDFRAKLRQS